MLVSRTQLAALALAGLPLLGCSAAPTNASRTLVTDVDQSVVKRQSIGNCWLYATASWLESKLKSASGQELDVSESYWTWWNWYKGIVDSSDTTVSTGGSWDMARDIIANHGFVLEGEFIPGEANLEMSLVQKQALNTMNEELSSGSLANPSSRSPENVRAALDAAFGTNMAQAETAARKADATVIEKDGTKLATALDSWQELGFQRVYGENTAVPAPTLAARKTVLKRALKALNDHEPVVISLMIDFGALDTSDATFKLSTLNAHGSQIQGGHMVVLEDYAVENAPGFGTIGLGQATDAQKTAALDGDVTLLKAKNSWGKNRPDRGLIDGYTSFDKDYLFKQLPWRADGEDLSDTNITYFTTLESLVIPPGY